ncbi:hypothetical protein AVEN_157340-1, partial [Araneus ventricosus]
PTPWYSPRLPSHVVPEHYDLHLHPSLTQGRFKGRVSIFVALQKPADRLLVHAAKLLNVSEAQVWSLRESSESEKIEIQERVYNEENEYLVLKMGEKLPFGRYRLYFEFEGPLTLSLKGFYKSSYLDPQTQQRKFLAATHLRPTYACRVPLLLTSLLLLPPSTSQPPQLLDIRPSTHRSRSVAPLAHSGTHYLIEKKSTREK